ncbi:putative LRR receptor-like serine/threonine-protein kinase [Senna tora]|uniref:Putative LRR receptor-like serine/threonine-protein kinase n=1 Tax=Senna tora TaxID=362788 RepID=A0A834WZU7_9FABA|nr:putative LRR receptor-like serine/threonine-protein kinase [Senna tora]
MFNRWGISAITNVWNISGQLCSGNAIDNTTQPEEHNPFIKCDCSIGTTCHITVLRVYALDVVGDIPEELWTLTYLTHLNLGQNYLTGTLPPAIGNLTRMQYLTFGINSLSGELPKELGNLTELIVLGLGTNNFSGSLPSELGNLLKLEQLYIDSSGLSGQIPPTFANLKNLETVWALDMDLTGRIPDFIGNWSKLKTFTAICSLLKTAELEDSLGSDTTDEWRPEAVFLSFKDFQSLAKADPFTESESAKDPNINFLLLSSCSVLHIRVGFLSSLPYFNCSSKEHEILTNFKVHGVNEPRHDHLIFSIPCLKLRIIWLRLGRVCQIVFFSFPCDEHNHGSRLMKIILPSKLVPCQKKNRVFSIAREFIGITA